MILHRNSKIFGCVLKSVAFFSVMLLVGCNNNVEIIQKYDLESTLDSGDTQSVNTEKVIIVTGEYPPYTSEKQKEDRFFIEIVEKALEDSGIDYELKYYPWARCSEMVESGEAWASFPYGHSEYNDLHYNFSVPIFQTLFRFYYLADNEKITSEIKKYDRLEQFKTITFGGSNGYWYGTRQKINEMGITNEWVNDMDSLVKMLRANRIDFLIEDQWVFNDRIQTLFPNEVEQFQSLPKAFKVQDYFLLVSKKYPDTDELLSRFDQSIKKMQLSDEISKILIQYKIFPEQMPQE